MNEPNGTAEFNPYDPQPEPLYELETVSEVAPTDPCVEPPALTTRPGPGLAMSLVWMLVVMAAQLAVSVFAALPALLLGYSLDESTLLLVPIGTAAVVVIAMAIAVLHFGWSTRRVLAWRGLGAGHVLLVVLTVGPLWIVATAVSSWIAKVLPSWFGEVLVDFGEFPLALVLVGGCLFPALGEEILFRGFIGRGLVARYGVLVGMLLTSVLFGLMHVDPAQAASVMPLGWVFQVVFLSTKSLAAPILLHALINATSFLVIRNVDVLGDVEHVPPLLFASGALALVAVFALFYQSRSRWVLTDGSHWSPGYVTAEEPPRELGAVLHAARPAAWSLVAAVLAYVAFLGAMWAESIA
jgi:membrane protease YdiL (CAAX protease family)